MFLDEIGDISTTIQTKLLRVLQTKEIKPLGDTKSIHVDVRVVASTNRNLAEKIKKGEFREDLFYRLNVLPIELPPVAGKTRRYLSSRPSLPRKALPRTQSGPPKRFPQGSWSFSFDGRGWATCVSLKTSSCAEFSLAPGDEIDAGDT